MEDEKVQNEAEEKEVPNAKATEVSTSVKFSKDCNIIPATNGKMGHQEDVIYVETTRIVDGEPIQIKELFTKDGLKIGYVDSATGAVVFEEAYRDKLKETLGDLYEQLGLDDREIKMEDVTKANEFVDVLLDKDIEGLTKEEIESILREHGSQEIKDKLEALKEEKEVAEPEPEDLEEKKQKIADDFGIDADNIDNMDLIRDAAACNILLMGRNVGYPTEVKMKDGTTHYASFRGGKYEELNGFTQTLNVGEFTNLVNQNGTVDRVQVLSRTYNPKDPNSCISMVKTGSGEVVTVVERLAYDDEFKGNASVSREMVKESNSGGKNMSGNTRDLVDNATTEDIISMDREIDQLMGDNPQNVVRINDLDSVDDEYKKGLVEDEQLAEKREEKQVGEDGDSEERTPWGDAEARRNRETPQ